MLTVGLRRKMLMGERENPRFDVQWPVSFSGPGVAGGGLVSCVSVSGCTVVSEEPVTPGTFLSLHIHLPEQYVPLAIDVAEVRWATGTEFGVEFRTLRAQEQERLRRVVDVLGRSH